MVGVFSNPLTVCSMNCKDSNIEFSVSDDFGRQAKRFAKKIFKFKDDYKKSWIA